MRDTNRLSGVSSVCYGDLHVLLAVIIQGLARLPFFFFSFTWTKAGYQAFLRGWGEGKMEEDEKEEVKGKGSYLLFSLPCALLHVCPPPRMRD